MKTVESLINELSKYPKDSKVIILAPYDDGLCVAGGEIVEIVQEKGEIYIITNE